MLYRSVTKLALALPEVTAQPHFDFESFRVRGKIFLTVPPDQRHAHLFLSEHHRAQALEAFGADAEPLRWGQKIVGVRVRLRGASREAMQRFLREAWAKQAPKSLWASAGKLDAS